MNQQQFSYRLIDKPGITAVFLLSINFALAIDESQLPAQVQAQDTTLILCGEVTLRALGLFKFGYGGLYLANCSDYEQVTGDVPKQWSVLLTRNAKGKKLNEIAEDSLANNFNDQQLAALKPYFSCITAAYQDTPKGARIDVRYLPDTGLQLWQDNTLLADCGAGAGAAEYFRIWFGEQPFNRSMKRKILTKAAAKAAHDSTL